MKRVLLVLMMWMVPLGAQEQKTEAQGKPEFHPIIQTPNVQKVFILKYADPENLRILLSVFGGGLIPNFEMHALAVTAQPATMQAIEDAIARLDVPAAAAKNLDFTIDLVVGTDAESPGSASVPKDLEGVIAQLKAAFPFKSYRLLDILTLRARAGKRAATQSSGGTIRYGQNDGRVSSDITINSASLGADGTTLHLDGLKCFITYGPPTRDELRHLTLQTDVDIKEGQKVVVGRMGMESEQAMFIVLTVKVVQ